jgi:hypothetical protein
MQLQTALSELCAAIKPKTAAKLPLPPAGWKNHPKLTFTFTMLWRS